MDAKEAERRPPARPSSPELPPPLPPLLRHAVPQCAHHSALADPPVHIALLALAALPRAPSSTPPQASSARKVPAVCSRACCGSNQPCGVHLQSGYGDDVASAAWRAGSERPAVAAPCSSSRAAGGYTGVLGSCERSSQPCTRTLGCRPPPPPLPAVPCPSAATHPRASMCLRFRSLHCSGSGSSPGQRGGEAASCLQQPRRLPRQQSSRRRRRRPAAAAASTAARAATARAWRCGAW